MAEKFRVFSGVIYPDSESYNYEDILALLPMFKEYAYALHDSDVNDDGDLKKAHIHWVGRGDPRRLSSVASKLGLAEHDIEIGRDFKALVQYLIHKNDPDKFQYDSSIVVSNLSDIGKYYRDLSEGQIVRDIASAKLNMSWYDLIQYAVDNDCYDILRRNLGIIKLVHEEFTDEHTKFCFREPE